MNTLILITAIILMLTGIRYISIYEYESFIPDQYKKEVAYIMQRILNAMIERKIKLQIIKAGLKK